MIYSSKGKGKCEERIDKNKKTLGISVCTQKTKKEDNTKHKKEEKQ